MEEGVIVFPVNNYGGHPYVKQEGDKYYIVMESELTPESKEEISKEFYEACKKEFKK
jgi:hypothetical protein